MIRTTSALLAAAAPLLAALPTNDPSPAASAPDPTGWRSLFDGASLDGWTETGGPYDGDADWTVEDGAIVGREAEGARGGLLYTEELFDDFEFECDVRIHRPFDSGIFVRMREGERGAQFTLDDRPGGEICGIYSNGWILHETGGDAAWTSKGGDEWKHVRVRCVGTPMHLVAWIDGERVVDHQIADGLGEFCERGRIGIQVHGNMNDPEGSAVHFRDLRVRELPAGAGVYFDESESGARALTAVGEASGWRTLFNGADTTGWTFGGDVPAAEAGFRVQGGELQALAEGRAPYIRTERDDHGDFELRMDFKLSELCNSGIFLRSGPDGNPSFNGCEVQILDDFNWEAATGSDLADYQFTGGLYGAVAPAKRAMRPLGVWNTYQLHCVGSRMQCVLNGVLLWDVDTDELEPAQGPPFAERLRRGFIGMQRHAPAGGGHAPAGGGHAPAGNSDAEVAVSFRNIFLRELDVAQGER